MQVFHVKQDGRDRMEIKIFECELLYRKFLRYLVENSRRTRIY